MGQVAVVVGDKLEDAVLKLLDRAEGLSLEEFAD